VFAALYDISGKFYVLNFQALDFNKGTYLQYGSEYYCLFTVTSCSLLNWKKLFCRISLFLEMGR
jgi:hypothetical protein